MTAQHSDDDPWVRVPTVFGSDRVDITRLKDGRVMCQLCFTYTRVEDLHQGADGQRSDVCAPCGWVAQRQTELHSVCPCDCCLRLAYWVHHGRDRTIADACNCAAYLDKDLACTCPPCTTTYRRGDT